MKKERYEKLKKISIEKSGIIKTSMSDPIYKFCVLNNIDNFGDFIEIYNIKRSYMDKKYNFNYFDGIIDLFNLVFFKEELPEVKNLVKKIKIFRNDVPKILSAYVEGEVPTVGNSKNITLKRLGFNNTEAKVILKRVINIGEEVTIIDAIKSCIDNFNFKKMTSDDEMFITKLYVLYQYYDECNKISKNIKEDNYKEVEKKANELYTRMLLLQRELVRGYIELEKTLSDLPENEKSKTLVRKFRQFNCK